MNDIQILRGQIDRFDIPNVSYLTPRLQVERDLALIKSPAAGLRQAMKARQELEEMEDEEEGEEEGAEVDTSLNLEVKKKVKARQEAKYVLP